MTHLAGGQEGVLQGRGHGDPAVRGEARVQSSEQSDWAHEATPTLPHSVCHLAIKFTDCCKVCTGTGPHPGPGPGLLTPSHCNVSAAHTNTMKAVPLGRADHCEHDRVLRLWTSDLCGGGGRGPAGDGGGGASTEQSSFLLRLAPLHPALTSLLVTVSTSGH